VVLAIGDMHLPNCLNIPGEDLPHVSHFVRIGSVSIRKLLLASGVPLATLLREAGASPKAQWFLAEGSDVTVLVHSKTVPALVLGGGFGSHDRLHSMHRLASHEYSYLHLWHVPSTRH